MFPSTIRPWLCEYCESESPGRRILLNCREVREGLLVKRTLQWIGRNQDSLDELIEILIHGGLRWLPDRTKEVGEVGVDCCLSGLCAYSITPRPQVDYLNLSQPRATRSTNVKNGLWAWWYGARLWCACVASVHKTSSDCSSQCRELVLTRSSRRDSTRVKCGHSRTRAREPRSICTGIDN